MWRKIKMSVVVVVAMVTVTGICGEYQQNWFVPITMAFKCMASIECGPSLQGTTCHELREYKVKYHDGSTNCVPCSKCQRGQCVASHCFEYTDTACRMPRQDEYIERHVCIVCSDCGKERIVVRNCTKHADTDCGDCKSGYTWDPMVEDCVLSKNAVVASMSGTPTARFTADPLGYLTTLKPEQMATSQEGIPEKPFGEAGHIWIYILAAVLILVGFGLGMAFVKVVMIDKKCQKKRKSHTCEDKRRDDHASSVTLLHDKPVQNKDDKGMENASSTDCQHSNVSKQEVPFGLNDDRGIIMYTNCHVLCNVDEIKQGMYDTH